MGLIMRKASAISCSYVSLYVCFVYLWASVVCIRSFFCLFVVFLSPIVVMQSLFEAILCICGHPVSLCGAFCISVLVSVLILSLFVVFVLILSPFMVFVLILRLVVVNFVFFLVTS